MTQVAQPPKAKGKRSRMLTGVFPALWCWLSTPDTKFNADGEYRVDLVMTKEEATALVARCKEEITLQATEVRKQDNGKAAAWKTALPIKLYEGDDEELRGKYLVNFKQKIKKDFDFHVDLYDARKQEIKAGSIRIGNGSKINVCFNIRVVADNINRAVRVLFHPIAAQIVDLVKWESNYGFDEVDGFTTQPSGDASYGEVPDFIDTPSMASELRDRSKANQAAATAAFNNLPAVDEETKRTLDELGI